MKKLYIGNLPYSITNESLGKLFESFDVISAVVIVDKYSGRSKGFGFVEVEKGDEAIAEMNGKDIEGRPLKVDEARPRDDQPRSRSNMSHRSDRSDSGMGMNDEE